MTQLAASVRRMSSLHARLQYIRKRVGNSMQLAPRLMTRGNMVNDRVAFLASKQVRAAPPHVVGFFF